MAKPRFPYPNPNEFRDYVTRELLTRSRNAFRLGDVTLAPGKAIPTPTIQPFVRFTSGRKSERFNYRFFHLGLHGMPNEEIEDRFGGSIFEMQYGGQDVVGYAFNTTDGVRKAVLSNQSSATVDGIAARGLHPIPGVTDIKVKHQGPNLPIDIEVVWKCYNTTQLEFLRQHFLMAGGWVIIEFGHNYSNRPPVKTFNWNRSETAVRNELASMQVDGRQFTSDARLEEAEGNYDIYVLQVMDHSIEYHRDNTFTCTTKCMSIGEAMFGVSNFRLLGALDENSPELAKTIADFFRPNHRFDQMLNEDPVKDLVVKLRARNEQEVREGTEAVGAEGETAEEIERAVLEAYAGTDGRFIPFTVLMNEVMDELFKEITLETAAPASFILSQFNASPVGNHHLLSSIDPDTLVIVKPFMVGASIREEEEGTDVEQNIDATHAFTDLQGSISTEASFQPATTLLGGEPRARNLGPTESPFFVAGTGDRAEEKGLLQNGVWVAVDAVRRVFLSSNTFYASLVNLLSQMSQATGDYWDLDLAFDEETNAYTIYDRKCVFADTDYPDPYVFNRSNEGELLDAKFNASMTKEVRAAIFMSQGRMTTQEIADMNGDEVVSEGGLNLPNTYTQVLWTPDVKDILDEEIIKRWKAVSDSLRGEDGPPEEPRSDQNQGGAAAVITDDDQKAAYTRRERIARQTDLSRFQNRLGPYIALHSEMTRRIVLDGRQNPNKINNLLAPIPTELDMTLTIQGISGLAFWDTFLVEKLPKIFQDHGVFLIKGISHSINADRGWTTSIEGIYYFVKPLGGGIPSGEPTTFQDGGRQRGETPTRLDGSTLTAREKRLLDTGGIPSFIP